MSIPLFNWLRDRAAGVLLHPTSLPGSTGIGTFGREARHFIDFMVEAGLKYWQVCPLGPTGMGDSPYQCFSAFAGNPYFIDLETLVAQHYLEDSDLAELRRLPAERVDYGAQWILRRPILKKAYSTFIANASSAEKSSFAEFKRDQKDWLDAYTRFTALKRKYDESSWQFWPAGPTGPRFYSKARKSATKAELAEEIDAQAWFQFQFFSQWLELKSYANARGIQIFGDIPIFVAMDSSDVWTHPALFKLDDDLRPLAVAGVPPDYFAAEGQLWGNPLYDWDRHHATNYEWWLSRLRASFKLFDVVRIDHFRGFDEYCEIPANAVNATVYKWVKGPGLALFEAIQKEFPDAKLVAEDLGIITDSVRALVEATGVPGMKVLQFGFEGATEYLPHNLIPNSVLYPGTHDNDTAWGWFSKQSEPVKDFFRQYLRVPGDAVPWDMLRAGYASSSCLFIVPMQDFLNLGTEARLNMPGQPSGNWQWRFTREQLDQLWGESAGYLRLLAKLYER
jgi:4-alpha-glucanotransferase